MSHAITIHAKHYATGAPTTVTIADGRISSITAALSTQLDADYVAPAFFDLQINGCLGLDFSSAKLESADFHVIVEECRRHGIAAFCPTLITNSFENLIAG